MPDPLLPKLDPELQAVFQQLVNLVDTSPSDLVACPACGGLYRERGGLALHMRKMHGRWFTFDELLARGYSPRAAASLTHEEQDERG